MNEKRGRAGFLYQFVKIFRSYAFGFDCDEDIFVLEENVFRAVVAGGGVNAYLVAFGNGDVFVRSFSVDFHVFLSDQLHNQRIRHRTVEAGENRFGKFFVAVGFKFYQIHIKIPVKKYIA